MKPSVIQLLFADGWVTRFWIGMFVVLGQILLYQTLFPPIAAFQSVSFVFMFLVSVICVGGISYLASLIVGCMILPPVFLLREKLNGAPFHQGDKVIILKRSLRGQTARVAAPGDRAYGAFLDLDNGEKIVLPHIEFQRIE